MRLLVIGSWNWNVSLVVQSALEEAFSASGFDLTVVQTGASGAEAFARDWASRPGVTCWTVPLEWGLADADACVVFAANNRTRETSVIDECRRRGVPVRVYSHSWPDAALMPW